MGVGTDQSQQTQSRQEAHRPIRTDVSHKRWALSSITSAASWTESTRPSRSPPILPEEWILPGCSCLHCSLSPLESTCSRCLSHTCQLTITQRPRASREFFFISSARRRAPWGQRPHLPLVGIRVWYLKQRDQDHLGN